MLMNSLTDGPNNDLMTMMMRKRKMRMMRTEKNYLTTDSDECGRRADHCVVNAQKNTSVPTARFSPSGSELDLASIAVASGATYTLKEVEDGEDGDDDAEVQETIEKHGVPSSYGWDNT
eukprot:PhM_4_TR11290/c1_g1_i1/m.93288